MRTAAKLPRTMDDYLASAPKNTRGILSKLRRVIARAAPEAVEAISYRMPTFRLQGRNLVHFAAFQDHIGFYPIPSGIQAFKQELSPYLGGKGSVRFPLARPIPYSLVERIVRYRVKEELARPRARDPRPRSASAHSLRGLASRLKRPLQPMPADIRHALIANGVLDAYRARPPYQRNDYLSWIVRAKRAETRRKRLDLMLDELARGGRYMKMVWRSRTDRA